MTDTKCYKCGATQPETFGDLIQSWRGDKNVREAGEASGVSAATISRLERGELPDIRTFVMLVMAMGVTPEFAFELVRKQMAVGDDKAASSGGDNATVQP